MKKIITIVLLLIALNSEAQIKNANLQASGLTCAMCSKAVYKALSGVAFVDKVTADIEHSSYEITFKPGSQIDLDALGKAVIDAGFSVSKLKVSTGFTNTKIENDTHISVNNQSFHFVNVTPQTLNGVKTITLVDKDFVTSKEYKKIGKLNTMMGGKRVYNVTL